jgi:hypothetical protein
VNVIIALPVELPKTSPVEEPTDAIAELLLLQAPIPELLRSEVEPIHTEVAPPIGKGNGLTVILKVVVHPVGRV